MGSHPDDPDRERRREAQFRRFGTRTPECSYPGCKVTDPDQLVGTYPDIFCYEHDLIRQGKRPYEAHHVAGRHNSDVTIEVPANDHRTLSEKQRLWPEDTLRNPDHALLIVGAAHIRGWIDVMAVIIEALGWIPELLEDLHHTHVERFGDDWDDEFGLRDPGTQP